MWKFLIEKNEVILKKCFLPQDDYNNIILHCDGSQKWMALQCFTYSIKYIMSYLKTN